MRSFRILNRRAGALVAAFALFFSFVIPTIAAAATVTERSIELSSSTASAPGVHYTINFTPVANAGAFVVDLCSDTPLYGEDCATPAGLNLSGDTLSSATSGFTSVAALDANTLRVTGTITAPSPVSVDVAGITNPSAVGTMYARIVTFDTASNANAYVSNPVEPAVNTGLVDNGGVAMSITNKIGVSAAVLESLTFCTSGEGVQILVEGCAGTLTAPVLKIGETVGDTVALSASALSTGHVYTQLSTNALGGAIVSLKSSNDCGGLKRFGASSCDIAPALAAGFTLAGNAKFGVKLASATNAGAGTNSNGTLQPAATSNYDTAAYKLNFPSGNGSGVSSTYGDPLLDTADAPVNNKVMDLTFGASITNSTPAGLYSADLSLIATGKF